MLSYAGLPQLGVDVELFGGAEHATHPGIAAWFAGIEDGRCKFGLDRTHVEDAARLTGVLCHEMAHA